MEVGIWVLQRSGLIAVIMPVTHSVDFLAGVKDQRSINNGEVVA